MCGEHAASRAVKTVNSGSSPHVRGALGAFARPKQNRGIIPACAGSTTVVNVGVSRHRDHPRMCGEHYDSHQSFYGKAGSSPHVRGALSALSGSMLRNGIIPACAGSTRLRKSQRRYRRDHPRMCGEHVSPSSLRRRSPGSSPHVRGAPCGERCDGLVHGIIPACAGSTRQICSFWRLRRDHPRMCGEHISPESIGKPELGSSPHVRGAPQ